MKKQHGGKRKGAGNKPKDGATGLKRKNVMVTDGQVKKAVRIGGGLSLGVRKAIDDYKIRED